MQYLNIEELFNDKKKYINRKFKMIEKSTNKEEIIIIKDIKCENSQNNIGEYERKIAELIAIIQANKTKNIESNSEVTTETPALDSVENKDEPISEVNAELVATTNAKVKETLKSNLVESPLKVHENDNIMRKYERKMADLIAIIQANNANKTKNIESNSKATTISERQVSVENNDKSKTKANAELVATTNAKVKAMNKTE